MTFALTWNNEDGTYDVVEFDTVDTEDHTLPNEVTEFPVEQGPDVTDNVRVKPRTLSVKGYISDTPLYRNTLNKPTTVTADYQTKTLDLPARPHFEHKTFTVDVPGSPLQPNASSLLNAGLKALFGSSPKVSPLVMKGTEPSPKQSVQVLQIQDFQSRVRAVFDLLKKARDTKAIILAVTDFDEIDGLVIENLTMPRSVDDGTGAVIGIDLRQITIANSLEVEAPKPAEGLGQPRKFTGSKAAKEDAKAEEKAEAARKSFLLRLGGGLTSLGQATGFLPGGGESS